MEYIIIDRDKLKVMLEKEDLDEWDIDAESLDYANPEAKQVFEEILGYAKTEFGFDTGGCRVLLQLFPSRDGGCEIFITRLKLSPLGKEISEGDNRMQSSYHAYVFEELDDLLALCSRLYRQNLSSDAFLIHSSAFVDSEGKWYLLIECTSECDEYEPFELSPISFISEYATALPYKSTWGYLSEYAESVCRSRAVSLLAEIHDAKV